MLLVSLEITQPCSGATNLTAFIEVGRLLKLLVPTAPLKPLAAISDLFFFGKSVLIERAIEEMGYALASATPDCIGDSIRQLRLLCIWCIYDTRTWRYSKQEKSPTRAGD